MLEAFLNYSVYCVIVAKPFAALSLSFPVLCSFQTCYLPCLQSKQAILVIISTQKRAAMCIISLQNLTIQFPVITVKEVVKQQHKHPLPDMMEHILHDKWSHIY